MYTSFDVSTITSVTAADNELGAVLEDVQSLKADRRRLTDEFWTEFNRLRDEPSVSYFGPASTLAEVTCRSTYGERQFTAPASKLSTDHRAGNFSNMMHIASIFHEHGNPDPQRNLIHTIKTSEAWVDLIDIAADLSTNQRQLSEQTRAVTTVGEHYGRLLATSPARVANLVVQVSSSRRNRIGVAHRNGRRASSTLFTVKADPLGWQLQNNGVQVVNPTDWVGQFITEGYSRMGESDETTWDLAKAEHAIVVLLPAELSRQRILHTFTLQAAIADGRTQVDALVKPWQDWSATAGPLIERKDAIESFSERVRRGFGGIGVEGYGFRSNDIGARLLEKLGDENSAALIAEVVADMTADRFPSGGLSETDQALLDAAPAQVTREQATASIWPNLKSTYFDGLV